MKKTKDEQRAQRLERLRLRQQVTLASLDRYVAIEPLNLRRTPHAPRDAIRTEYRLRRAAERVLTEEASAFIKADRIKQVLADAREVLTAAQSSLSETVDEALSNGYSVHRLDDTITANLEDYSLLVRSADWIAGHPTEAAPG